MTSLHEELIAILKEEKALLVSLYQVVSEERDAIVGLNSQELERILTKKQETLLKLSLLEKEREKLLSMHDLNGKSLSEIIDYFENMKKSTEANELKQYYLSMKTLLESISEIQRINEQLIDRSIVHITTAMKFIESFGITPKQSVSREA
ncbi:flagellar protein FlgN [Thermodesulfovibrio hydrogeniphilus]